MIYKLSRFVSRRTAGVDNALWIIGFIFFLYLSGEITLTSVYVYALINIVLYSGILNRPYLFIYNYLMVWANKKWFKEYRFIYREDRKILFRKKKKIETILSLTSEPAVGVIVNNKAYIDSYYKKDSLLNMWLYEDLTFSVLEKFYEVEYFDTDNGLLKEIEDKDSEETILKKVMLYNLGMKDD